MVKEITPYQRKVFRFIGKFQKKFGYSPSHEEMALAFNVRSKNSIFKVVNRLVAHHLIEKNRFGRIKFISSPKK